MPYDKENIPPISEDAKNFKIGRYRHFKGFECRVICIGRSSENREEEFVVYTDSAGCGDVWIRPLKMFIEDVNRGGYSGPRFKYLGE